MTNAITAPELGAGDWIALEDNAQVARGLVKEIAKDIGAQIVAYIEVMCPQAIKATTSTFRLSVRNSVYNEIMAAIEVTDEGKVRARLRDRARFRRWWLGVYRQVG